MWQTGPIILRFRGFLGVDVEIGQTLAVLVALLAAAALAGGSDPVWLLVFVAMILGAIYLHELGHAWASLVQGVAVRRIVLHGGGGFCEQAQVAGPRQQEFIVAMGPLVNLGLWAVASLALEAFWAGGGGGALPHYLSLFATINLAFFAFNLIPAQPLDGGRLLHLGLLRVVPRAQAGRIAGAVGLLCAILWWPALVWVFLTTGWLLLFMPSFWLHYRMMRGEIRL